ncbi:MAG: RiPP maturation radical SAM C-methyltransferase [Bryobacteraceae bacterium]
MSLSPVWPRVALVDPPFGSAAVPSLGLALLSSAAKRLGFDCRTFFWTLDLTQGMYGQSAMRRLRSYQTLTGRAWYPFNEWIFAREAHGDALEHCTRLTRQAMRERAAELNRPPVPMRRLLLLRERAAELVDAMADQLDPYDIVGIGSTFFQNLPALALARRVKQRWPAKTVVLGGANCDGEMGRALMERFPFLDYAFSGEVDHSFPRFLQQIAAGENRLLPGMIGRDEEGSVVEAPQVDPVHDLDGLPLPDFDDYIAARERAGWAGLQPLALPLESSRGCWWGERQHCTFCGLNADGMVYRRKSPERFQWEVEELKRRYGMSYVMVTDNIMSMDYYETFLKWSEQSNHGLRYFYEIKSNVKRRHAERLARGGVTAVQPGIEQFSSGILSLMRKGVTGIQNVAFLRYARENGILLTYNLLVGFPGEDPAEYVPLAGLLPKLSHLRPPSAMTEVEFHRFSPYHSEPGAFGLRLRPNSGYKHLYPFDAESISRIAYFFEPEGPTPDRRYLRPVFEALAAWGRAYREDDCTLVWRRDEDGIVVDDRRPGFGPREHRLQGAAAFVFPLLDEPRSLAALVREAEKAAAGCDGAGEFSAAPEAVLDPLVAAGLVYEELSTVAGSLATIGPAQPVKQYCALPVSHRYRQADAGWFQLGM